MRDSKRKMPGIRPGNTLREDRDGIDVLTLVAVQVYEFHDEQDGQTYRWNATAGRQIAEARQAEVVQVYPAQFGMSLHRILVMYPDLDKAKALSLPPLALLSPLLFVTHRNGSHVLIDGWHRLYLAVTLGIPSLPAYLLTMEETKRIRLDIMPQGKEKLHGDNGCSGLSE